MPKRKSHLKSRSGCSVCKLRKIKCDEQKPSCGSCNKRKVRCSFQPTIASPPPDPSSVSIPSRKADLELLHNYCVKTCLTHSSIPRIQNIYRTTVVSAAFSHDYLLHAILAVSAFQLSCDSELPGDNKRTEEAEAFRIAGHHHNNVALSGFRSAVTDITEDNHVAIISFTFIVLVMSLVQPRPEITTTRPPLSSTRLANGEVGLKVILDWLRLVWGVKLVAAPMWPWLLSGPMRLMIVPGEQEGLSTTRLADTLAQHLVSLEKIAKADTDKWKVFDKTLSELRDSFPRMEKFNTSKSLSSDSLYGTSRSETELLHLEDWGSSAALAWPCTIPDEFFKFLEEHDSVALLILATYSLLLSKATQHWWLEGWSHYLLRTVYLLLEEPWLKWIEWPMTEAGLKMEN